MSLSLGARSLLVSVALSLGAVRAQISEVLSDAMPSASPSPLAEPDNVPPQDDFIRRLYGRAAVIGDFLYIDGEEVAKENTWRTQDPVNATLAIDLTKSWTPEDVVIIETPIDTAFGKQILLQQAILIDESTDSFYSWAGRTSHGQTIRDPAELWHFQPDGEGKGTWEDVTPEDSNDAFFSIKRMKNSAFASTPDQGFIFGGFTEAQSTREPIENYAGFISFDFASKEWTEHTEAPYSPSRTLFGGGAVFVPGMGSNGLIFIIGGISSLELRPSRSSEGWVSFEELHFMDPVSKDWYSQKATGQIPPVGLYDFCIGGVAAEDGRFDIFMYGGRNTAVSGGTDYSHVYVLSLPGFHWTAVTNQSNQDRQRREHVCAVAGNRHLISWGGLRGATDTNDRWEMPDAAPNGIAIFDMSALEWINEYRADADAYEQNDRIKTWYDDGGLKDVKWNSTAVKALFVDGDNGTSDPSPSSSPGGDSDSGPPIGPIVGGVVGGVAVIGIIAGVFWFLRRKKKRAAHAPLAPSHLEMDNTETKYASTPAYGQQGYQDAPGSPPVSELPNAGYAPQELRTQERYEMDATGYGGQYPAQYNR